MARLHRFISANIKCVSSESLTHLSIEMSFSNLGIYNFFSVQPKT